MLSIAAKLNSMHSSSSTSVIACNILCRESRAHSGALQTSLGAAAGQRGQALLGFCDGLASLGLGGRGEQYFSAIHTVQVHLQVKVASVIA